MFDWSSAGKPLGEFRVCIERCWYCGSGWGIVVVTVWVMIVLQAFKCMNK